MSFLVAPAGECPRTRVFDVGRIVFAGEDFEVVGYLNNDRRGTGQVILRGISREDGTGYTGLRTLTFTIRPRRTENIERY